MSPEPGAPPSLEWAVEMPLLTNRFFLYDMGKVAAWTGLVMAVLLGGIMAASGGLEHLPQVAGIFAAILFGLFALFALVSLVFFGNRFPMGFTVGPAGIGWTTLSRRARIGNRAALVAGVLSLSAGTAGAGLLAVSNESGLQAWADVSRVRKHPEFRVISIMNSWRVVIRLYCTPDNYSYVEQLVDWYRGAGR